MNILVLDEDALTTQQNAMLLRKAGCDVHAALNVNGALTMLDSFPVDLVVMSLRTPGADLYHAIRSVPKWRELELFIVTGAPPEQWNGARTDPHARVLRKGDAEPDELLRAVESFAPAHNGA